jgi:hypothetical protein
VNLQGSPQGTPIASTAPPRKARGRAGLRLLAVAALGFACSSLPPTRLVHRSDDTPGVSRAAYNRALRAWTRYASHYEGLDHRFFLGTTWESWPFREQRVLATAEFLNFSEEETRNALERERQEALTWIDFFVGFYTADSQWNDLSSPTSIWRVELEYPDGTLRLPTAVERVVRPDANTKALYPYVTSFWQAYRIRFPQSVDGRALEPGGYLVFRISSAVGHAETRWPVAPYSLPDGG